MCVQVRIVLHRFDNVVHLSLSPIAPIFILLILSGRPVRGLLYPCLSEIMRGSLIGPRAADMDP